MVDLLRIGEKTTYLFILCEDIVLGYFKIFTSNIQLTWTNFVIVEAKHSAKRKNANKHFFLFFF